MVGGIEMSSNIDAGYNLEAAQQLIISALGIGAEIVEDIDELDSNYIAKIAQNWYTQKDMIILIINLNLQWMGYILI